MKISSQIVRGSGWTTAAFGASQFLRFASNLVLARLLSPDLFGIMAIVTSVRTGISLFTDVGIGQNIIYNDNAENPDFYNTAWTINLIRCLALSLVCFAAAVPLARFYRVQELSIVLPVAGLSFVLAGLTSLARPLVQKRMQYIKLNSFDFVIDLIGYTGLVILAFIHPTIWGLVFGGLFVSATSMVGSYVLLPSVRHRLHISEQFAWEIIGFGKWIFISSIAYFLSMNFDRLYLAKVVSLNLLGVYGVARAFSEPVTLLVTRLSNIIIFPLVVASKEIPRPQFRRQLASIRMVFLLAMAAGLSVLVASADVLIRLLYDQRYQAASWMVPVLFAGAWFSIMCNLNESTLLGFGKPSYAAFANGTKLGWLLIGLPLGFATSGPLGAVVVVAVSDLFRYVPIFIGQVRARFSFGMQDLAATLVVFGLISFWEWVRWVLGFNTIISNLPIVGHN
jgi:O-antigen/teichoic acid export membrane protein